MVLYYSVGAELYCDIFISTHFIASIHAGQVGKCQLRLVVFFSSRFVMNANIDGLSERI